MNNLNTFTFKSNTKFYWRIWLGLIIVLLVLRFSVFLNTDQETRAYLIGGYIFIVWLSMIVINLVESCEFLHYMKNHHYEEWKKLSIGGHGFFYTKKNIKTFLSSEDNFDDPNVPLLKNNMKQIYKLMMSIFWTFLIFAVICLY